MKRCCKCKIEKPPGDYYSNPATTDGLGTKCKECCRADSRAYHHERMKNPEYRKKRSDEMYLAHILHKMGISRVQYQAMVERQGGRCAICDQVPPERLRVDHDHATGAVRELLCRACNSGIGWLQDDIGCLESAIRYLRRHGSTTKS